MAGEHGADPHGHLAFYRSGLLAGTDPESAQPWPRIEVTRQALVEAASLVLALHLTRTWLWDTLAVAEQDRVVDWLGGSVGVGIPDNNWVMFKVMVQEFIASTGRAFHEADITDGLARIEDWYVGEGWYRDGAGQRFDYYAGWAMHLYPSLWTMMAAPRVPELAAAKAAVYRERLARYLTDFQYFFGANGSPLFQGRSLIYRFAATAPLWLGELLGVSPLDPGATRRLASGALRHFNDGGAFDDRGLLPCGWFGPFAPMTQSYSGPGSPYWTSKAFIGLMLPADHPVWTATETAGPVETADAARTLAAPGFLLSSTAADGVVRLANHGSDNQPGLADRDDPHYSRFAFSTHAAPDFNAPLDNHIAVLDAAGVPSRRVRILRRPSTTPATQASAHHPVWGAAETGKDSAWTITSATAMRGPWELRVHVVESENPATAPVREGGYAVAAETPGSVASRLIPVLGHDDGGTAAASGANPMTAETETPWLSGTHHGTRSVFASLAVLSGDPAVAAALAAAELRPELHDAGGTVTVTIIAPDGHPLSAGFRP